MSNRNTGFTGRSLLYPPGYHNVWVWDRKCGLNIRNRYHIALLAFHVENKTRIAVYEIDFEDLRLF